jgi:hypothetical protein
MEWDKVVLLIVGAAITAIPAFPLIVWRLAALEKKVEAYDEHRRRDLADAITERDKFRAEKDAAHAKRWADTQALVEVTITRASAITDERFARIDHHLEVLLPMTAQVVDVRQDVKDLVHHLGSFTQEARAWNVAALRVDMDRAKDDIKILRKRSHELAGWLQRLIGRDELARRRAAAELTRAQAAPQPPPGSDHSPDPLPPPPPDAGTTLHGEDEGLEDDGA